MKKTAKQVDNLQNPKTAKKQSRAKLAVRFVSVFLIALICVCSLNLFDEKVAGAAVGTQNKLDMQNQYFQSRNGGNMTAFNQMEIDSTMDCLVVNVGTHGAMAGTSSMSEGDFKCRDFVKNNFTRFIWQIKRVGENTFKFYSTYYATETRILDVPNGNAAAGQRVRLWNDDNNTNAQLWNIVQCEANFGCYVVIYSKANTSLCLDLHYDNKETDGNNEAIKLQNYNANAHQQWIILPLLQNAHSTKYGKAGDTDFISTISWPHSGRTLYYNSNKNKLYENRFSDPSTSTISRTRGRFKFTIDSTHFSNFLWEINPTGMSASALDTKSGGQGDYTKIGFSADDNSLKQRFFIAYSMNPSGGYYLISANSSTKILGGGFSQGIQVVNVNKGDDTGEDLHTFFLNGATDNEIFCISDKSCTVSFVDVLPSEAKKADPTLKGDTRTFTAYFNEKVDGSTVSKATYDKLNYPADSSSEALIKNQHLGTTLTVERKLTLATYTIEYNANGGTGTMDNSTHEFYKSKALTANTFKRAYTVTFNYNGSGANNSSKTATATFNGWATSSGGSKVYNDNQSVQNVAATKDTTVKLYAKWTLMSITLPTPSRTGYTFGGWYKESSLTNKLADGGGTYTPESNITLYAKWTPITYTIVYNINGGNGGATESSTHTYDEAKTLTENGFTKKYDITFNSNGGTNVDSQTLIYPFDKWTTNADGTGDSYAINASVKNLTSTKDGTITLYAQWNPKAEETITLTTPTRDGYEFFGWSEGQGNPKEQTFITTVNNLTKNITVYAYWYGIIDGCTDKLNNNDKFVYEEQRQQTIFTAKSALYYGDTQYDVTTDTYQWYAVNNKGETLIVGATGSASTYGDIFFRNGDIETVLSAEATVLDAYAIKCVLTSTFEGNNGFKKTMTNNLYSAYIPSNRCVDATVFSYDADNKKECYLSHPININSLQPKEKRSIEFIKRDDNGEIEKAIISQIKLNELLGKNIEYKVYGVTSSEAKILVLSNIYQTRTEYIEIEGCYAREGTTFDKYIVEITNTGEEVISGTIDLLELPRMYMVIFDDDSNLKTSYKLKDGGGYSTSKSRVPEDYPRFFYEGDEIKIDIRVPDGEKLTAGSHLIINGMKVFPTQSVPTNGYISFIYTNYYEYLIKRKGDEKLNSIQVDTEAEENIVEKYLDFTEDKMHNLNFGPLGAKIRDDGKIRFGTVWYFDDKATQNSWSRSEGMGTYLIPLINIFKTSDTNPNDFIAYLEATFPKRGEEDIAYYQSLGINSKWSYAEIKAYWESCIANKIVSKEGIDFMLPYLKDFINTWNSAREDSNTSDLTDDAKLKKVSKMSFGGAEKDAPAKMYYYKTDENGKRFMEYSVVMDVKDDFKRRQLIYIPYASFVADWDHGYLAPNNDKYADDIYLYQAPTKVYTYNEVYKSQYGEGDGSGESGSEVEPQHEPAN